MRLDSPPHPWLPRPVSRLSPQTLTRAEQSTLLAVATAHLRDYLAFSNAFGTGLRLAQIAGLDVGDVYPPPASLSPALGSRAQGS